MKSSGRRFSPVPAPASAVLNFQHTFVHFGRHRHKCLLDAVDLFARVEIDISETESK